MQVSSRNENGVVGLPPTVGGAPALAVGAAERRRRALAEAPLPVPSRAGASDVSTAARAAVGARAQSADATVGTDGAAPPDDPPVDPSRVTPERLAQFVAIALGDPTIVLSALQGELRDQQVQRGTDAVEADRATAERTSRERADALRRSERAARRAKRFLGHAPKWVKKLVEAIIIVAGAVASVFSGGAAAGLAIAGAVLLLAADGIQKAAVALGMDPSKAKWVGIACKVAGAAMMLGAGFAAAPAAGASVGAAAGSSAASAAGATASTVATTAEVTTTALTTAQQTVETLEQVQRVVQAVQAVVDGTRTAGNAVATHTSDQEEANAQDAAVRGDLAEQGADAEIDAIRQVLASIERSRETLAGMAEVERSTTAATVRRMA